MEWNPIELERQALASCSTCEGSGVRCVKRAKPLPCKCAFRSMFRACYARFRDCMHGGKFRSRVTFERTPSGRSNRGMWGRKEEEYMADFELVAKRTLDAADYRLFRVHFLLGADWRLCEKRLGIRRGNFFHGVYRIEAQLGEAFAALKPYAIYPPRDYFAFRMEGPVEPSKPIFVPARPMAEARQTRRRRRARAVIEIRRPRVPRRRTA